MQIKCKRRLPVVLSVTLLAAVLSACGVKAPPAQTGMPVQTPDSGNVTITKTKAKATETELYSAPDGSFSMQIPAGWSVSSGGTGMYHSIRVTDPEEPLNQMFVLLKADVLLHSQAGKEAWQYTYAAGNSQAYLFTLAPVLAQPSTENFYKLFPQYADFAVQAEPGYAGYTFPRFEDFTVTERFPSAGNFGQAALGDELLRATFTEDGREGEGMFAATVVDFGPVQIAAGAPSGYQIPSADGGYYMAYNIMAVTAAKDTLIEWEDVLTQCMGTLEYSQAYVQSVQQAGQEQVAQAMQFSANGNAVLDGIMSSWEARSTSQDIISQKQSDATLGYERVYDTQTGEIYRAENGWSDTYQGGRYEPVTDDSMYTEPISGYIE